MQKITYLIIFLQICKLGFGQNIQYNLPLRQFSEQPMVANPSLTGSQSQISIIFRNKNIYRNSFVIGDGYKSFGIIGEKSINNKFSTGLIAYQSKSIAGTSTFIDSKQSTATAMVAYSKILKDSLKLSIGANAGIWNIKDVRLGTSAGNPKYSHNFPILGLGISIRNKVAFLGISIPQILNNSVNLFSWDVKYPKTTYLNTGIKAKVSKNVKISAAFMLGYTKGLDFQSYLNTNLIFGDTFTIGYSKLRDSIIYGISYRNTNSLNISLSPSKRFSINYLLDASKFIEKPVITNQVSLAAKI